MPRPTAPDPHSVTSNSKRRVIWIAVALSVVAGVLAFGVFGVHTLFVDDTVAEAGPTFDSGATGTPDTVTPTSPTTVSSGEKPSPTAPPTAPVVRTARTGSFEAREHPGTGSVLILTDGTQSFVRFEDDFATDNGPDLYVTATVDGRRIELAALKGNVGAQNYELPADVDPDAIEEVTVWCRRFDATFTAAAMT